MDVPDNPDDSVVPDNPDDSVVPDEPDDSVVLECQVDDDRGGWWVVLVVAFRDEVVRRRIGPYLTRGRAQVAAHHIERAAGRQAPPPTGL